MHLHPSSIIQKIRTMKDKLISVDYEEKDTDTRMLLCREAKHRDSVEITEIFKVKTLSLVCISY
jgi:hypothetical protein